MPVQRITVAGDQHGKLIAVTREYTLDNALIRVVLINEQFWLRRPHDDRVTQKPRPGQGIRPTVYRIPGRHVFKTSRPRRS